MTLPDQCKSELVAAGSDASLKELFDKVLPLGEILTSAHGSFLQLHGEALVGEPVFQFVVPSRFRDLVLQTCHDNVARRLEVKKT